MRTFDRYKENLRLVEGNKVYSYTTHVATVNWEDRTLTQLGYWSKTTQKHINHVASELDLTIIK